MTKFLRLHRTTCRLRSPRRAGRLAGGRLRGCRQVLECAHQRYACCAAVAGPGARARAVIVGRLLLWRRVVNRKLEDEVGAMGGAGG